MPGYQTMIELAVTELRRAIMRGDLPPGTRLVPAKLAQELGLSRVSIREAVRELCGSLLAETLPNVGARVASPPTLFEIEEIFKVRLRIEPKLAVLGAERITEKEMEVLWQTCRELDKGCDSEGRVFLMNRKFHETLYQPSGMNFLCRMVGQFADQILMYRSLHGRSRIDIVATNREHKKIIQAIEKKNKKAIRETLTANIRRGLDDVRTLA